jgi:AbrB family looped-hinge helix DNA binding protein
MAEDSKNKSVQDLTKELVEAQMNAFKKATQGQAEVFGGLLNSLTNFSQAGAVFKTTVQKTGRISIPEAEREALGIKEGDLVQVVVIRLKKS